MKNEIKKIFSKMKLGKLGHIPYLKLLPDGFKPEKKHLRISIGLAILYSIIGVICMIFTLLDSSRGYLKIVVVSMFVLSTIFMLITIEIRKRLVVNTG